MTTYDLPTRPHTRPDITPTTIPAGTYWVGDPCYANDDDRRWMAYGDSSDWFQDTPIGTDGDAWCVGIGTAYGDGTYTDRQGREYPVDAGMIGVTPAYQWAKNEPPFGSHLVTFNHSVQCRYDVESQTIIIGDIEIPTGDEADDEYDDSEY